MCNYAIDICNIGEFSTMQVEFYKTLANHVTNVLNSAYITFNINITFACYYARGKSLN